MADGVPHEGLAVAAWWAGCQSTQPGSIAGSLRTRPAGLPAPRLLFNETRNCGRFVGATAAPADRMAPARHLTDPPLAICGEWWNAPWSRVGAFLAGAFAVGYAAGETSIEVSLSLRRTRRIDCGVTAPGVRTLWLADTGGRQCLARAPPAICGYVQFPGPPIADRAECGGITGESTLRVHREAQLQPG